MAAGAAAHGDGAEGGGVTPSPAIPWRERPLLRIAEVAGLCGDNKAAMESEAK